MTHFWKKLAAAALASAFLLAPAAQAAQAITPQQLKDLLQEYYINDVPQAALEADTVEEIIEALGDPYTAYMDAESYAAYESSMSDETLVGIGITGTPTDEGILVVGTYTGAPAEEAGVVPGDLIFFVEGGPEEQDSSTILALLKGEVGSEVTFRVRHADGTEEAFTTHRAVITIPATTTTILDEGATGYISSSTFGAETQGYFVEGTQDRNDVDLWIVDMRKNSGGSVSAATQSLGVFLGTGTMVYLRNGSNELYRYVSQQDSTTISPAIVLVSPYTASSAEIYALAMKDKHGGMVIGSNTYGKGVAQIILTGEQLPDVLTEGDALRITAFQSYGVSGNTPNHIGVIPDLLVDPNHADEIALLFSSREPSGDNDGWARIHLGNWRWFLDLSQATAEETASYFGEMLSAVPPGCKVFLGSGSSWKESNVDELARVSGAVDYTPRRFTDTEGTDCQLAADTLHTYGILNGMGDGTYQPEGSLTRAQLCALLVQAMNLPASGSAKDFDDVSPDAWYAPYIKAAQAAGYVEGMGNNRFSPNTHVTHEQLITVLGRLAAELNLTFRNSSRNLPDSFDGVPAGYSDWAKPWAWLLGLSQKNYFNQTLSMLYAPLEDIAPQADATRGETAQILYKILYSADVINY